MTTTFGAKTDYFGLADSDWEMQSSSITPETSQAQSEDENGDIDCEERYEETASVEVVYKLKSNGIGGKVDLPAGFIGGNTNIEGGETFVITGGTLATSNTERPILTVTGESMFGDTVGLSRYDFADETGEIDARKLASAIGFTVGGNTRINSTSVSYSAETSRTLDADGEIAIVDVYRGRIESTGDLATCTGTQTATAAATWTLMQDPSKAEENTAFMTGSIAVFKNLKPVVES